MENNREVLKGFFGNLKSCGDFIGFIFITSATRYPNNLIDISLNKQYATICGFTQELKSSRIGFHQELRAFLSKGSRQLSGYTDDVSDPVSLLYQSGYLTIKDYDEEDDMYLLGFLDKEVETAFLKSLFPEYVPSSQTGLGTDIFALGGHEDSGSNQRQNRLLGADDQVNLDDKSYALPYVVDYRKMFRQGMETS